MFKGKCVREGCSEVVDFGDIEVINEGFVCGPICEAIVLGKVELAWEYDEFGPA
jgi:hypothetical protein